MSLEGLLAIGGIAIAVYAIPGSAQRRSISLLVPRWIVPGGLLVSAFIVLYGEWLSMNRPELLPPIRFQLVLVPFIIPLGVIAVAVLLWNQADLNRSLARRFHAFLLASVREGTFDELVRVLEKNEDHLGRVLAPETLGLLFEPRFVRAMTRERTWLHLRLLSNRGVTERLPSTDGPIDTTIRAYLAEPGSILHAPVACSYGAEEHFAWSEEDQTLIHNTFENPEWHVKLNAAYPLIMVACEHIDSGRLDDAYNRNDDLYVANQGVSSRTKCPVFVAIKTHVLMLKEAVKRPSSDTKGYGQLLWDIFRAICQHSRFVPDAWHSADREFATPYAYLLNEILYDFKDICLRQFERGKRAPEELGRAMVIYWSASVGHLVQSKNTVSPQMQKAALLTYLDYVLQLRDYRAVADADTQRHSEAWTAMFIDKCKHYIDQPRELLHEAVDGLDGCVEHVYRNQEWLRKELGVPARRR